VLVDSLLVYHYSGKPLPMSERYTGKFLLENKQEWNWDQ